MEEGPNNACIPASCQTNTKSAKECFYFCNYVITQATYKTAVASFGLEIRFVFHCNIEWASVTCVTDSNLSLTHTSLPLVSLRSS